MTAKEYDFNHKRKKLKIELAFLAKNKMPETVTKSILQQLHQGGAVLALFKGRER